MHQTNLTSAESQQIISDNVSVVPRRRRSAVVLGRGAVVHGDGRGRGDRVVVHFWGWGGRLALFVLLLLLVFFSL